MNDLHSLHDKINESFVGRLHDALSQLRSGADCVSQTIESATGNDALHPDAAGIAEPGSDSESGQGKVGYE